VYVQSIMPFFFCFPVFQSENMGNSSSLKPKCLYCSTDNLTIVSSLVMIAGAKCSGVSTGFSFLLLCS
jgi:hypothetical protein